MSAVHEDGRGRVLVALGANLGQPSAQVTAAASALRRQWPTGFLSSSLWSSTPVDCPPGSPQFVNAVISFTVPDGETPETMLARLQAMERALGRVPKRIHNEPRRVDLDLIGFGAEVRNAAELTLPHPRAHLRRFVLEPLVEIHPGLKLPGWAWAARELLDRLATDEILHRLGPLPEPAD